MCGAGALLVWRFGGRDDEQLGCGIRTGRDRPDAGADGYPYVRQAVRARGWRRAGGEVGGCVAVLDAKVLGMERRPRGGRIVRGAAEAEAARVRAKAALLAGWGNLWRDATGVSVSSGVVRSAGHLVRGDEAGRSGPNRASGRRADRDEERGGQSHAVQGSAGRNNRLRSEPTRCLDVRADAREADADQRMALPRGHLRVERWMVSAVVQCLAERPCRPTELLSAVLDEPHAISRREG